MPTKQGAPHSQLQGVQYEKVDKILVFVCTCPFLTIYTSETGLVTPNFFFIFWGTQVPGTRSTKLNCCKIGLRSKLRVLSWLDADLWWLG